MNQPVQPMRSGGLNPWMADALWPGQRIVDRLRDQVAALRQVLLIDDIDPEAKELAGQLPGALVALGRLAPVADAQRMQRGLVVQSWVVFLVVRQARREAGANLSACGPLISSVVRALNGQTLGGVHPLSWNPATAPKYGANQSIFPLRFDLQVTSV